MNTVLENGGMPTKTWTYSPAGLRTVRLEAFAGTSELTAWDRDEIKIEIWVTIRRWSTLFLVEESLSPLDWDDETLSITRSEDTLFIHSKPNYANFMNWFNFPRVSFKVFMPAAMHTHVHHLFGGNILLQHLNGRHQLNTTGGDIRLKGVMGELKGRTAGGNLILSNCDVQGDISTFGGNIQLEHCKGEIKASSKGGNIKIRHCHAKIYTDTWGGNIRATDCSGDLKCYTSGGNIVFEDIQGNVGASTKGGNVRASARSIQEYFWLETGGGNITADLPLEQGLQLDVKGSKIKMPYFSHFSGIQKRHRLSGQLNGGGANVNLKTGGGNVTIRPYDVSKTVTLPEQPTETKIKEEQEEKEFKNWSLSATLSTMIYSFFVIMIFVYGLNSVFYFSLELMKADSSENPENTALFLLNITSAVGCFISVNVFIRSVERKYRHDWQKYLILIIMTAGFVRLGHLAQWLMYIYFPDNQLFWPHYWLILDYSTWNLYDNRGSLLFASIPLLSVSLYFYFWQKSRHFTRKISEQEYQLLNLEKLKTKAQLNALEARINPHFLYNSLNSIAGLVHQDPDKAEEMTIQLSKLFRYTTGRNEGHHHSVAEELEIVKSYLDIEQMRFGNRLQFSIDVIPDLLEMKIPRFLLQPLVENAIKHGISQLLESGKIEIKIEQKGEMIQFTIHDNGPAFKEEVGGGYGLRSIKDKLNLIYGEKALLSVQNNDYKAVIISLPLSEEEAEFK